MIGDFKGKKILIAGAGGGYDVFTGLPLYFDLIKNNEVFLFSFSFTPEFVLKEFGKEVEKKCFLIDNQNIKKKCLANYFPELNLSKELKIGVYAINTHVDLDEYEKGMKKIVEIHQINTIIAADGGCDSVLTGIESDLATPVEDMMTLYVVSKMKIKESFLTCLGTNVEQIDKKDFETCVKTLKDQKAFIGGTPINLKKMLVDGGSGSEDVKKYIEVFKTCNTNQSVINSSIIAALEGHEGKYQNPLLKNRISSKDSFPFIDESSTYLWIFDLEKVLLNNIYIFEALENLKKPTEIGAFTLFMNDHFWPSKKFDVNEIFSKNVLQKNTLLMDKILKKIEKK